MLRMLFSFFSLFIVGCSSTTIPQEYEPMRLAIKSNSISEVKSRYNEMTKTNDFPQVFSILLASDYELSKNTSDEVFLFLFSKEVQGAEQVYRSLKGDNTYNYDVFDLHNRGDSLLITVQYWRPELLPEAIRITKRFSRLYPIQNDDYKVLNLHIAFKLADTSFSLPRQLIANKKFFNEIVDSLGEDIHVKHPDGGNLIHYSRNRYYTESLVNKGVAISPPPDNIWNDIVTKKQLNKIYSLPELKGVDKSSDIEYLTWNNALNYTIELLLGEYVNSCSSLVNLDSKLNCLKKLAVKTSGSAPQHELQNKIAKLEKLKVEEQRKQREIAESLRIAKREQERKRKALSNKIMGDYELSTVIKAEKKAARICAGINEDLNRTGRHFDFYKRQVVQELGGSATIYAENTEKEYKRFQRDVLRPLRDSYCDTSNASQLFQALALKYDVDVYTVSQIFREATKEKYPSISHLYQEHPSLKLRWDEMAEEEVDARANNWFADQPNWFGQVQSSLSGIRSTIDRQTRATQRDTYRYLTTIQQQAKDRERQRQAAQVSVPTQLSANFPTVTAKDDSTALEESCNQKGGVYRANSRICDISPQAKAKLITETAEGEYKEYSINLEYNKNSEEFTSTFMDESSTREGAVRHLERMLAKMASKQCKARGFSHWKGVTTNEEFKIQVNSRHTCESRTVIGGSEFWFCEGRGGVHCFNK